MNYKRVYDELISRARHRPSPTPKERHHIVMRSLGGTDEESNLVDLTPREHFIAHVLLAKISPCKETIFAFNRMSMHGNSKLYQSLRNMHSKIVSDWSRKLMRDHVVVKLKATGKAVQIKKTEYYDNIHLYVGLNYGNRYEIDKIKGMAPYRNKSGDVLYLHKTDARVLSEEFKGINAWNPERTRKATLAAAEKIKSLPWYRMPKIDKSIVFALDVYDWFVLYYNENHPKKTGLSRCIKEIGINPTSTKYLNRLFRKYKDGYNPYSDKEFVEFINERKSS